MIKIKKSKLVYASLFFLSLAACGLTDASIPASQATIAKRQKEINDFDETLATLKQTVEKGKSTLANASGDVRAKYQVELDALGKKFDEASETQRQMKDVLKDGADDAWHKAKLGMETVSKEISQFAQKTNNILTEMENDMRTTERQKIIDQFETKLADIEVKINDGKKKLASVADDVRGKFEEQLVELNKKQQAAKDKLNELKQSTKDGATDAWQKVKAGLDAAWDDTYETGHKWLKSIQ